MKASKFKLADNDMWDPLVIGSNISLPHGHKKGRLDARDNHGWGCSRSSRRGHSHRKGWRRGPTVEVEGGGRERGSENQRWREMDEAMFVLCEEVIATPRMIGAGLLD